MPFDSIHVREDQVDGFLSEAVKGCSGRHDRTKQSMIVFNVRFLIRRIRITEEYGCLLIPICIVFKGKDIAEFSAVIGKQHGEYLTEAKALLFHPLFKGSDPRAGFCGGLVIQQYSEHEVDVDKQRVMMTFPPTEPIKVSISVQISQGRSSMKRQ